LHESSHPYTPYEVLIAVPDGSGELLTCERIGENVFHLLLT
jgi:hypothetical protein